MEDASYGLVRADGIGPEHTGSRVHYGSVSAREVVLSRALRTMILIIDNYDSFTYNLVHLIEVEEPEFVVMRNDALTVESIRAMAPHGILLSPGPGRPADAGICEVVIRDLGSSIPILGVCLGHQAIGEAFGGRIVQAPTLMHGKTSRIRHDGRGVFDCVTQDFVATRYHSLVVERNSLPAQFEVSAETIDGVIMGLRHRELPIEGVQFHPESILSTEGPRIVGNWVRSCHASVFPI